MENPCEPMNSPILKTSGIYRRNSFDGAVADDGGHNNMDEEPEPQPKPKARRGRKKKRCGPGRQKNQIY